MIWRLTWPFAIRLRAAFLMVIAASAVALQAQDPPAQEPMDGLAAQADHAAIDLGAVEKPSILELLASPEAWRAAQRAKEARDEQEKLVASQSESLERTRARQADLRERLQQLKVSLPKVTEAAKTWQIKAERMARESASAGEIDNEYDALIRDLGGAQLLLRQSLEADASLNNAAIRPKPINPLLDKKRPEVADLYRQFDDLRNVAEALGQEHTQSVWAQRNTRYEAMTGLNAARLTLIEHLSSGKHKRVTGFGSEGVAQAGRELNQAWLEARYYLTTGPHELIRSVSVTPKLIFDLLWIGFAGLVFRFWRRRGDEILEHAHNREKAARSDSTRTAIKLRLLSLWRGVRRPLDWAIFLIVLRWLWPAEFDYTAISILWLILFWTSCTFVLLRFINELVKGQSRNDPRAELRWRSLRLIGVVTLTIVLTLQTFEELVGRGTIYAWIASFAWVAVPALIVVLTIWWRDRIRTLAKAEAERSGFLAWIAQRSLTVTTLFPYILAGAILLLKSMRSLVAREVSHITLVRELSREMEREEAARKVAANRASGRYRPISEETARILYPHRNPKSEAEERSWPASLVLPELRAGNITAVVGDRGLGKSTLMRDLADTAAGFDRQVQVSVGGRGLQGVLEDLAARLELDGDATSVDAVATAISERGECLIIAIDDVHRLIIPSINGLVEFDELTRLARSIGVRSAVIATVERSSWDFLERARQDSLVFDDVVLMPRWSLDEVRDLIERRTRQANLEPDFSNVIDSGAFAIDGDPSPHERKKFQYFRRLHDYTDGNPAIALEFWRRSLFTVEGSEKVVALTFERPDNQALSSLPMPALLVLRAILQMGRASGSAIERSTNLPSQTVTGILRRLERVGTVRPDGSAYMVSLEWWLEVRRLLERRNLIVRRSE